MSGFTLGLGYAVDKLETLVGRASNWILAAGVWNDAGVWDDAAKWKDNA